MVDLHSLQRRFPTLDRGMVLTLQILQMPLGELEGYLRGLAEKNPMLEVGVAEGVFQSFEGLPVDAWVEEFSVGEDSFWNFSSGWHQEEMLGWSGSGAPPMSVEYTNQGKRFTEKLVEQLRLCPDIPRELLPHCIFLAESLDCRGYFSEDLVATSEYLDIDFDTMEEALYLLQEMQPTGVGARDLRECLLLQLVRSPFLGEDTLEMISQGAEFFEGLHFQKMSERLGRSVVEVTRTWQKIQGFYPIPTARFFMEHPRLDRIVPEAFVTVKRGKISLAFQHEGQEFVGINPELVENMKNEKINILATYQKQNYDTSREIFQSISYRNELLEDLIIFVTAYQKDYFTSKKKKDLKSLLKPLEPWQIAEALELEPTLVSRALCDKYIGTEMGLVSLQSLLTPLHHEGEEIEESEDETDLSKRGKVLSRMRLIMNGEDKRKPWSDEKMTGLLGGLSIKIARRTVAKYRYILKVPNASQRKIRE